MLFTYVHYKEYEGASHAVAHLYEHAVIHSFYAYLERHGQQPGFEGYVNGETFNNIIFLKALFYDEYIAWLYSNFLSETVKFDAKLISFVLRELETEDEVKLMVADEAALKRQLLSLASGLWIDSNSIKSSIVESSPLPQSPFTEKASEKTFQNVVIGVYTKRNALSLDEQTLLLRLSVIIGDILLLEVRQKFQCTVLDHMPTMADAENIGMVCKVRVRRDVSLAAVQELTEARLRTVNSREAMSLVSAHFNEFAKQASWQEDAVEYYRNTGIVTNNAFIALLATEENIERVLAKLKVHVRRVQEGELR